MAVDNRRKLKISPTRSKTYNSVAQMRWKLLAKALQEGRVSEADLFFQSIRKFKTFGLFQFFPVDRESISMEDDSDGWFQCKCLKEPQLELKIRLSCKKISIDELKGFDNTGNICIWPSEEVMAYYVMKNKEIFYEKNVLELGGGMTSLAGCVVAATTRTSFLLLTDGNTKAVQNIQAILENNSGTFKSPHVITRRLRWDDSDDIKDLEERFDVILSADCLFFDSSRQALVNTIWRCLRPSGLAIILAPTRGKTFEHFSTLAQEAGFNCDLLMVYDTCVWNLHCRYLQEKADSYVTSLHYPQMLILRKNNCS